MNHTTRRVALALLAFLFGVGWLVGAGGIASASGLPEYTASAPTPPEPYPVPLGTDGVTALAADEGGSQTTNVVGVQAPDPDGDGLDEPDANGDGMEDAGQAVTPLLSYYYPNGTPSDVSIFSEPSGCAWSTSERSTGWQHRQQINLTWHYDQLIKSHRRYHGCYRPNDDAHNRLLHYHISTTVCTRLHMDAGAIQYHSDDWCFTQNSGPIYYLQYPSGGAK